MTPHTSQLTRDDEELSAASNLSALLALSCESHPDRTALIDGQTTFTYTELRGAISELARDLQARGVRPDDRVAIALPNCWQYVVTYFAIQAVGAVAVLVNIRFTGTEIRHVLDDSGSRVVVTNDQLAANIDSAAAKLLADEIADRQSDDVDFTPIFRQPADAAQFLYTSGTTGKPKGAIQTHANLVYNAGLNRRLFHLTPEDRTLIAAPFFHATGMNSQLLGLLSAGGTCITQPAFTKAETLGLLAKYEITYFVGVATMLQLLTMNPNFDNTDLSRLRLFILGGAPVPESVIGLAEQKFPHATLGNVWGQTEATSITTYVCGDDFKQHPDTVGRPVEGVEVRVYDETADALLEEAGAVGELCVRGPVVTAGYWGRPDATAQTYRDGWLHTGDIGSIDADGYVRILDRGKDMIIRGGENVYSLEVENALTSHPDIAMAAVFGKPDELFGERVCTAIVRAPGTDMSIELLREHAAQRLADYKVPVEWHFVDEMPTNASGKILKRSLISLVDDRS
ncbi:class I adenylate-forming enzyme family protein [Rhodococcus opacus]|uniref:class I adenylate-forming enzyme family protein n=1 Tax=Rhodococcus opacus TaxID=37919 RepID=UPI001F57DA07|nr:class I adenylate-forming enzyme family protein [Rhodococcus opacus]UNN05321.1 acyl--CoA ligase [Rhodococcus opacus]